MRFGFREFWIDGRDFYLNGTPHLPLAPCRWTMPRSARRWPPTRPRARACERLKSFGINFVYTHNYGCEPGSHLGFAEILRAADDVGMLVSFSQPHFSHYDWQAADADRNNGYARHAEFYVRAAQNHPSVVMYSMSHNATGYNEDMNPDMIDGIQDARDTWAMRNVKLALRAEAIVKRLDPGRIVYHHASGNLGSMHAINFYPNFVPIQETVRLVRALGDAGRQAGVHLRIRRAVHLGLDDVPRLVQGQAGVRQRRGAVGVLPGGVERAVLRRPRPSRSARRRRRTCAGRRSSSAPASSGIAGTIPHQVGSTRLSTSGTRCSPCTLTDNWRAFRTWGVSANSPWEHHILVKLRPGVDRNRRELVQVDWDNLQRPGFSPDYQEQRYERMDLAYERTDWVPTAGGTGPDPQQPAAAGLHRRQARPLHQQGPQLPRRRDGRKADHRDQQLARAGELRVLVVAGPARSR